MVLESARPLPQARTAAHGLYPCRKRSTAARTADSVHCETRIDHKPLEGPLSCSEIPRIIKENLLAEGAVRGAGAI